MTSALSQTDQAQDAVPAPDRMWWRTAGLLTLLLPPTALAFLIDGRRLGGESIWSKPLRFEVALALHFATLALVAARLSPPWRTSRSIKLAVASSVAATAAEMVYILVQAARQQPSHFNVGAPLTAFLYYGVMAPGAVLITVAAAIVGWATAWDQSARLGTATRLGVVFGFIGGAGLTIVIALHMGASLSHAVGGGPQPPRVMPVTGWLLDRGDLRIPHFLATHAIQALPLLGLALDQTRRPVLARQLVLVAAALWFGVTLLAFIRAVAGEPPLPL